MRLPILVTIVLMLMGCEAEHSPYSPQFTQIREQHYRNCLGTVKDLSGAVLIDPVGVMRECKSTAYTLTLIDIQEMRANGTL